MADQSGGVLGGSTSDPGQSKQRVLFLGPDLSFSYAAAHAVFPQSHYEHEKIDSFDEIFQKLEVCAPNEDSGEPRHGELKYDYAIVPVANSTNGPVVPVVDLLRRTGDGTLFNQLAKHGVINLELKYESGTDVPPRASLYPEEPTTTAPSTTSTITPTAKVNLPTYPSITLVSPYIHRLPVHHYLYVHPSCPIPAVDPTTTPPTSPSPLLANTITSIHTHPQVWGQCSRFLLAFFPDAYRADSQSLPAAEPRPQSPAQIRYNHASTSSAASYVASTSPSSSTTRTAIGSHTPPTESYPAAICSLLAGRTLGLKCVAAHIEDDTSGNRTTFAVLGHRKRDGRENGE